MANTKLYLVFAVLLFFGNTLKADIIPEYLKECYNNVSLLHRENRLPMTLGTLVEIIRKVESETTMDMRNLASSLLLTFRVDGIQYMPNTLNQDGVIPFGVIGDEQIKWRLLRERFLERPSVPFPNNTITAIEKCALHFMLSKSIDTYVRGDESIVCNNIRTRRNVPDEPNTDAVKSESPKEEGVETSDENTEELKTKLSTNSANENSEETYTKSNTYSTTAITEQTMINSTQENLSTNSTNANDEKTQITSHINITTENSLMAESNNTDGKEFSSPEPDATVVSKNLGTKAKYVSRILQKDKTTESSTCPIENGVIFTKYGSVNIGNVIAGIATGLNPMDVPLSDNSVSKNFWAATLAGDTGEVAVLQGPKNEVLTVGAEGGWNSTVLPHYYFLKRNEKLELTDADVRGGLDGLIIAKNIMKWNDQFQKSLRLSQLLSLYYSEDGVISKDARACERRSNFSIIAPLTEAIQETYQFSRDLNVESYTQELGNNVLYNYSQKAAGALTKFFPGMQQVPCSTSNNGMSSVNATRNVELDLYIIIDRTWEFRLIRTLIMQIADKIELYSARNTAITIIASDGFQTLVNSTTSINDLYQWFNASIYYGRGQTMDLKSLLEKDIFNYFTNQLDILKQKNEAAGISTVVLLLPQGSLNLDDTSLNAAQRAVSNYKSVLPDLHLIYYVSSGGDRLNSLVENPSTDIITYPIPNENEFNVDKLMDSLGRARRRIYNPVCGANGKTQSYNSVKYNEFIPWKHVNYYKLSSKYLFGVKSGNIKVRENGFGKIRTCYSREVDEPIWSSNADSRVTCIISSNNDSVIPLQLPCDNYEFYYQCPPLYVSIEGLETMYKCRDSGCSMPTDVLVTISHDGLTCGVACILSSKFLLIMVIIILFKNIVSIN